MRLLLAIILSCPLAGAGEVWLFLKDGSVGTGDPSKDPATVSVPGGTSVTATKDQISFQRTREQVDQAVVAMVQDLARGQNTELHTKRFAVMKCAATAKLLEFLKHAEARYRLSAMFALQYAWSPEALEPVAKGLQDADAGVRKAAYGALGRNVSEKKVLELIKPLADSEDVATAAMVFSAVDMREPDGSLKRIRRLLHDSQSQSAVGLRISHYLAPALTADTLPLLESKDAQVRRAAMVGLIAQLVDAAAVRAKIRSVLADGDADLREIAAEYFTWLGQSDDAAAIQAALTREKDVYVRAALDAALRTISRRAQLWSEKPESAASLDRIRQADALEPTFIYEVGEHEQKERYRERAFQLQNVLGSLSGALRNSGVFAGQLQIPAAAEWIAPVREYFDPKRKSFGFHITKEYTSFVGSVHVGDDCGWRKELRSVVAVAPGVVRSARHCYSWGFIVVIEHVRPGGQPVCSLYAHLSPMLHVKPGDIVAGGQKIGSIGRAYTVDNGGYGAHLHFGLHNGAYGDGSWVCGYISTESWAGNAAKWLDPQALLSKSEFRNQK
ncbi:MAG TPA: peptidoglycan DD-metalloendopeptidase family protein [Planctomycetota bacterium]|jgi:murein DD-endopeptidase MepM/ murein hydrolase activator NlpD